MSSPDTRREHAKLWGAGVIGWVHRLRNGGELTAQLAARRDHPTTLHALWLIEQTGDHATTRFHHLRDTTPAYGRAGSYAN